jgi:hypothetical protein
MRRAKTLTLWLVFDYWLIGWTQGNLSREAKRDSEGPCYFPVDNLQNLFKNRVT